MPTRVTYKTEDEVRDEAKITHGRFECHDRSGLPIPITFFVNEEEQKSFEILFNEKDLLAAITEELQNNAIVQHKIALEEHECNGKLCCGIMEVAVPFELYKRWENDNRVNGSI